MGPRSRLPLSPSLEARLSDDTSASQDSLVSTGSNQELKTQLDTTLAEVEAITTQLEKQKLPSNDESQRSPTFQASTIEVNTSPLQQHAPPKPRRLSKDSSEFQPQQNDLPHGNAAKVRTHECTFSCRGRRVDVLTVEQVGGG